MNRSEGENGSLENYYVFARRLPLFILFNFALMVAVTAVHNIFIIDIYIYVEMKSSYLIGYILLPLYILLGYDLIMFSKNMLAWYYILAVTAENFDFVLSPFYMAISALRTNSFYEYSDVVGAYWILIMQTLFSAILIYFYYDVYKIVVRGSGEQFDKEYFKWGAILNMLGYAVWPFISAVDLFVLFTQPNLIFLAMHNYFYLERYIAMLKSHYLTLPGYLVYNIPFYLMGLGVILIGLHFKQFRSRYNYEEWHALYTLLIIGGLLTMIPYTRAMGIMLTMVNYFILSTKLIDLRKQKITPNN
ncbi:MAG: hypothetical protein ACP6IP_03170 [Candidatus Njordarchaeia archaeon]